MATQVASLKRLIPPFEDIVVDGFNFEFDEEICYWFLTHAHADHTCGLKSTFDKGIIYCSSITKRLVTRNLGKICDRIRTIDVGETKEIETKSGKKIQVKAYDAWHCPGSLVFQFQIDAQICLHTGDMRARPEMIAQFIQNGDSEQMENNDKEKITTIFDHCYLDTTYCKPHWNFPSQPEACALIERIAQRECLEEPTTLFICPAYSVGKENAIEACCRGAQTCAIVTQRRAETLRMCQRFDENIYKVSGVDDDSLAKVIVQSSFGFGMRKGQNPHDSLKKKLSLSKNDHVSTQCRRVVMLRCTGWEFKRSFLNNKTNTYEPRAWIENEGATRIYGIPYSEHSSFSELKNFVAALKPRKIIPTVNAETYSQRDSLRNLLIQGTDLYRFNPSKLDFFFSQTSLAQNQTTQKSSSPSSSSKATFSSKPPTPKEIIEIHDDDDNSLTGVVFDVLAPDKAFKLFKGSATTSHSTKKRQVPNGAADLIRKRLRSLGATVGRPATHLIVPEGTSETITSLRVYSESWLVRKLRAHRSSTATS